MKTFHIFFLSVITLFLGCASTSNLSADFDDAANFDEYSTYVLCIDDLYVENTKFPKYDNLETRQLIADEIDHQLQRRGHKTNVLNPELQAGLRIVVSQEEVIFTNCELESEYGYWKNCTLQSETYTTETLVVYVSDIKKNQIIWQAKIDCDLNKPKKALKTHIKNLVEELYNQYPKSPGKREAS